MRQTLAAGFAVLALHGCQPSNDAAPAVHPTATVHARAVEVREFRDQATGTGTWKSTGEVVVSAPFAGVVDSLFVQPGDRVAAGQDLAFLVTTEARAGLRGAALLTERASDDASRADAARALELAKRDVVPVPLQAPQAGTVTRVSTVRGVEVAASSELVVLVPDDAIMFEAHFVPVQAARIRPGQPASIEEIGGDPRAAEVVRVLPVADSADQSVLVWLRPKSLSPLPTLDRAGTATIETGEPRRSPAVPAAAVVEDDLTGATRVARVTGSPHLAEWTPVTLGPRAAEWRELLASSLRQGDLVITEGHRGLPDSTLVEVAP